MIHTDNMRPQYSRVMLKISGEGLKGSDGGYNPDVMSLVASEVSSLTAAGVHVCMVVGGGNIVRGDLNDSASPKKRAVRDYMGMMATLINALALQNTFEDRDMQCRVMSAIPVRTVCEDYVRRRAIRHLEKGRVIILGAGTGNPFFTTDTAAVLRATELCCNVMIKLTQVDGVYTADPKLDSSAQYCAKLSYIDVIEKNLGIMDAAAISLARDNNLPIIVLALKAPGAIAAALGHSGKYTIIS